jgi:hypothetical protein
LTVELTEADAAARRAYRLGVELLQRISPPWDENSTWAVVWRIASFGLFDSLVGMDDDLRDGLSGSIASHLALFAADWSAAQQAAA